MQADPIPFKNPLAVQPHSLIKSAINNALNQNTSQNLDYADLLTFLVKGTFLDNLLLGMPQVKSFISLFTSEMGMTEKDILKIFLTNAGAFIDNGQG